MTRAADAMPTVPPLHHWFLRGLERAPDRPALRLGRIARSYAELHETAARWAGQLRSQFRTEPARVAILTEKTETRYLGYLAALYAGATVVPLNPRWPASRIERVLAAASVGTLIVDRHHQEGGTYYGAQVQPPVIFGPADQEATAAGSRRCVAVECPPDDIAYIIFTSGSTGEPKGVPISHRNVGTFLAALDTRYDIGPDDVFSQFFELSFDLSIFETFGAWSRGACVCPVSKLQAAVPPRATDELGITVWMSTPSLATILRHGRNLPAGSLSRLRYTVFCGEPLPARTAEYWMAAAPAGYLDNLYGPTEAAVACTGFLLPPGVGAVAFRDHDTVPIGWPFPEVDLLVDRPDGMAGPAGELCLAGPQVFGGYLNPSSDAERFTSAAGRRWYRTGDLVRGTESYGLVHLGRADDQVKINGYRVELAEVEHAVERCVPGVSCGAIVLSTPDELAVLGAFVTCAQDRIPTLRADLADELPPYMLPANIWHIPQLPLNHNGKTDRPMLRDLGHKLLGR